jgi:hypothetical protein
LIKQIVTGITILFFLILSVISFSGSKKSKINLLFAIHYLIFALLIALFIVLSRVMDTLFCTDIFIPLLTIIGIFDFFIIHKLISRKFIVMDKQRFQQLTYIEKIQGDHLGEQKSIAEMVHNLLVETDITAVFYTTFNKHSYEMVVRLWDEKNAGETKELEQVEPIFISDIDKNDLLYEQLFKKFRTRINLNHKLLYGRLSHNTYTALKRWLKSYFFNFLPLYETEDNYYALVFFKKTIIKDLNIVKLFGIQAVNAIRLGKQKQVIQTSNQELNHLFELQKFLTEDLTRDDLLRNIYFILAKNLKISEIIIFELAEHSLVYRGIWDYSQLAADLTYYKNDALNQDQTSALRRFSFNMSPDDFIKLLPKRYVEIFKKQLKHLYFSILPIKEGERNYTLVILPTDTQIHNTDFYIKFFFTALWAT